MRPLDHIVLPCPDLAAAAGAFEDLGFTVGRRNRHPWGTENHVIQFDGAFVELIAMAPGAVPPPPEDDAFPFAGFLAGLGSSREPSGMIVLRSADARADAASFLRDGLGEGRTLFFARDAAASGGGVRRVSFTLAFARAPGLPDIGFFTCQQHAPENFWDPALQRHANGATGLAAVTLAAAKPEDHARFLAGFAGGPPVSREGSGIALDLGNGRIEVIGPETCLARFGVACQAGSTRLVALRFAGRAGGVPAGSVALDRLPLLLFG